MMAHNTTVDFSAQNASFVNKIGTILKATSDDEDPTQGVLFKEIIAMSYESSESLVEFLIDRLRNKSCYVRFKVLKVLKHLCEHGSYEVKLGLQTTLHPIRECTKFGGPPHPIHGNAPYIAVRTIAGEVCEYLYNLQNIDIDQCNTNNKEKKYGGLGSFNAGVSTQGFGNTPAQPKGIGDAILDAIERITAKINETPKDRQAALLASLDLNSSTSHYQPPVVPTQDSIAFDATLTQSHPPPGQGHIVRHRPGKAGGGWNDDEDDDDDDGDDEGNENTSETLPSQNRNKNTFQFKCGDPYVSLEENSLCQEFYFVTESVSKGSTGRGQAYLSPSNVTTFLSKCSRLECHKVVKFIANYLTVNDTGLVTRALQLLEGLVYCKNEFLSSEDLATICKDKLLDCYRCFSEENEEYKQKQSNTPNEVGVQVVKMKVLKIILILQQLAPKCAILPQLENKS